MRKWTCKVLTMAMVAALGTAALADELKVRFSGAKPPILYEDGGQWKGIEISLMNALMKSMGHTMKTSFTSYKRLNTAITEGVDVAVAVQPLNPKAYYSDDFFGYENYVISLKSKGLKIESFKDLAPIKVATWQNSWEDLGPEFKAIYAPQYKDKNPGVTPMVEFADQTEQNMFFWSGRADALLIDRRIFQWMKQKLAKKGVPVVPDSEVVYHALFNGKTMFKVEFKDPKIRDAFNTELKKMRVNGSYDKIVTAAIME